jgi:hypothetical protein
LSVVGIVQLFARSEHKPCENKEAPDGPITTPLRPHRRRGDLDLRSTPHAAARRAFLERVDELLRSEPEIDAGAVGRACREAQRMFVVAEPPLDGRR